MVSKTASSNIRNQTQNTKVRIQKFNDLQNKTIEACRDQALKVMLLKRRGRFYCQEGHGLAVQIFFLSNHVGSQFFMIN